MKLLCYLVAGAALAQSVTSSSVEELSRQGRRRLAEKNYPEALKFADETYRQANLLLKDHALDADRALGLALGAAIEVRSQVMNAQGQKAEAITYLRDEMDKYHGTSIITRLQKNLHLINLEGKRPPALDVSHWVGSKPTPLAQLKGKPVVLFFWAHWCGDCKGMAPALARLAGEFAGRATFLGPTQHYGYVAGGREADADTETAYIEQVRRKFYAAVPGLTVPVSEDNFRMYGASTTPTLVLIDSAGVVRMYHPGAMTYEELKARLDGLSVKVPATSSPVAGLPEKNAPDSAPARSARH